MHYLWPFLFLVMGLLTSCSSTGLEQDPKIYYVRDLSITALGVTHYGVGTIGYRDSYNFKIKSPGRMSTLLIQTCHRQEKYEDIGKRESIDFTLSKGIEGEPGCNILRFSSFDEKGGKHAEGIIIIRLDKYLLPAKLQCNGESQRERTSTICQSKEGLYQRITFDRPVLMVAEDHQYNMETKTSSCDIPIKNARKEFLFQMPSRECQFIFVDPLTNEMHYLFTSGHEQMLIRN